MDRLVPPQEGFLHPEAHRGPSKENHMSKNDTNTAILALLGEIKAVLVPEAPVRKPAKKTAAKRVAAKPVAKKATTTKAPLKGAQSRSTLGGTAWKRALAAKARRAGSFGTGDNRVSVYSVLNAESSTAKRVALRKSGATVDEALAEFIADTKAVVKAAKKAAKSA